MVGLPTVLWSLEDFAWRDFAWQEILRFSMLYSTFQMFNRPLESLSYSPTSHFLPHRKVIGALTLALFSTYGDLEQTQGALTFLYKIILISLQVNPIC